MPGPNKSDGRDARSFFMRLSFGIAMAFLAASLSAQGTLQVGGSSYLGIAVADITTGPPNFSAPVVISSACNRCT